MDAKNDKLAEKPSGLAEPLKQWFKADGILSDPSWFKQQISNNPLQSIQTIDINLKSVLNNWQGRFLPYFAPAKVRVFILQAVNLCNEQLELLLAEECDPQELRKTIGSIMRNLQFLLEKCRKWPIDRQQDCPINILFAHVARLLATANSSTIIFPFNSRDLLDTLRVLREQGLLLKPSLASAVASIGLLANSRRLAPQTLNIHWLENVWFKDDLTALEACQYLIGLGSLSQIPNCLDSRISMSNINHLLSVMVDRKYRNTINPKMLFSVVSALETLLASTKIGDISGLNMQYLSLLLTDVAGEFSATRSSDREEVKVSSLDNSLTPFIAVKKISLIYRLVNKSATVPKKIPYTALKKLLEDALQIKTDSHWPTKVSGILLAAGHMVQDGHHGVSEKLKVKPLFVDLISQLDNPEIAKNLSLSDIAHALYALALLDHETDPKLTSNLLAQFQEKLALKSSSVVFSDVHLLSSCNQVARYLAVSGLCDTIDLPPWIAPYITIRKPKISKWQRELITNLQDQPGFKERYTCHPEFWLNAWPADFYIVDNKGLRKVDFEKDGGRNGRLFHRDQDQLRIKDQVRDRIIERLKDKDKAANIEVCRIPDYPPNVATTESMTRRILAYLSSPRPQDSPPSSKKMLDIKLKTEPQTIDCFETAQLPAILPGKQEDSVVPEQAQLLSSVSLPDVVGELKREVKKSPEYSGKISWQDVFAAIRERNPANINKLLSLGALKDADIHRKADLLIEELIQLQETTGEIFAILLEHFPIAVITSTGRQKKGISPLEFAVKCRNKKVVEGFIKRATPEPQRKSRKKAKKSKSCTIGNPFAEPQWQKALQLAIADENTEISEMLTKAGVPSTKLAEVKGKIDVESKNIPPLAVGGTEDEVKNTLPSPQVKYIDEQRRLAKNGEVKSQYYMAWYHYEQLAEFRNPGAEPAPEAELGNEQALVYWAKAGAEQGHVQSITLLALLYLDGIGVKRDPDEAVRLNKLAANKGYATAQYNLGVYYAKGSGRLKNEIEALKWYRMAAEKGHASACNVLGRWYKNALGGLQKDEVEAVKWFKFGAELGHAPSQNTLAVYLAEGRGGLERDECEAGRWLKLAADQGNADAQFNLAIRYRNGTGAFEIDLPEALRLFKLAAMQGNAAAQNELACWYEQGKGDVERDENQACSWFKLAAQQGSAIALTNLAAYYEKGCGDLDVDLLKAIELYKLAAAKGRKKAELALDRLANTIQGWPDGEKVATARKSTESVQLESKLESRLKTSHAVFFRCILEKAPGEELLKALEEVRKLTDSFNKLMIEEVIPVIVIMKDYMPAIYQVAQESEKGWKQDSKDSSLGRPIKLTDTAKGLYIFVAKYGRGELQNKAKNNLSRMLQASVSPKTGGSPIHTGKKPMPVVSSPEAISSKQLSRPMRVFSSTS